MSPITPAQYAINLFAGLSDLEIREMSVKALREWRAQPHRKKERQVPVPEHIDFLLPIIVDRKKPTETIPVLNARDAMSGSLLDEKFSSLFEFWNWASRAALVVPVPGTPSVFTHAFVLTRYGERFVDRPNEDHPLIPGAYERLRLRCPNLPNEIASLLFDAHRCLDAGLMRPAFTMIGLAYEFAIEKIFLRPKVKTISPSPPPQNKAAARLAELKRVAEALHPATPKMTIAQREKRQAILAAVDLADLVRARRNDASHTTPTYGFEDRAEVEETLVSAMRRLAALWSIGR